MALLIRTKLAYCNVNGASVPFENQVVVNKAVASSRTNKTKQWVTFPPHPPPPPPPAGAPPPVGGDGDGSHQWSHDTFSK